jgi:hypothetical protein
MTPYENSNQQRTLRRVGGSQVNSKWKTDRRDSVPAQMKKAR